MARRPTEMPMTFSSLLHRLLRLAPDPRIAALERDNAALTQQVAALSRSEQQFRAYFENVPERLFIIDVGLDGKFRYMLFNPVAERTAGVSTAEARGIPAEELHPHIGDILNARYRECVAAGGPIRYEQTVDFRAGERSWETILVPIRDASGRVATIVGSARDISEHREAEQRLRQAQKMEALGQLTGGIAHDFNNLLTVVLGNLEIIRRHIGPQPKLEQRIDTAIGGIERGARLTRQLLAFARRQPLDPRIVDLGTLIGETVDLLHKTLGERIEIETVIDPELWRALVDPTQVESAVLNLALNARDAMPEGGRLVIELSNTEISAAEAARYEEVTPGPYVMIAVTDTGGGMPAGVLQKAFDPFFTTKPEGQGTGLGLSMVYGFTKQSGGHALITSTVGHGTTVRLYLPRARVPQAVSGDLDGQRSAPGTGTILVVEDDPEVREVVVGMLRDLGYAVLEAENAGAALAVVETHRAIDLLFTDVVMPGPVTTRQLVERTRALAPRTKVLFTTGHAEDTIVHGGQLDAGIQLLAKPYRGAELAARIRSLLAAE
jgi:PAS domain S-box-containing protein